MISLKFPRSNTMSGTSQKKSFDKNRIWAFIILGWLIVASVSTVLWGANGLAFATMGVISGMFVSYMFLNLVLYAVIGKTVIIDLDKWKVYIKKGFIW